MAATFSAFVTSITSVLSNVVIPLFVAAAFVAFLWGVVKYFFLHADSDDGRKEGRAFVIWGILGMVIFFSAWGIVNLLLSTLRF